MQSVFSQKMRKYLLAFLSASLIVVLALGGYFLLSPGPESTYQQDGDELVEIVLPKDEFGFVSGSYRIHSAVVRSGQTLSHILSGFDLTAVEIDRLAREISDVFNPRQIRAGRHYHGYFDEGGAFRHFIYEISDLEYLAVSIFSDVQVSRMAKEISTRTHAASGIVTSSLWNTMVSGGLNPELAIKLSEVLAWEVDFYRIQRGDRFKVVYQEDYVGERSVGIRRVDAVYFSHHGRDIYGFHFLNDTIDGYFNPEGENLRKVFLKAPLQYGRISSRYSHSRLHPILNYRRPHLGTDYAAPHGTPILAVGDGVVTRAAYNSGNGNYVRIRHNSVYETQYLHMSRFATGIRPGVRVTQGQVIGYVGSTGLATGPHVCFRFWKNGQQVDHLREEFPSADPLPEVYFTEFHSLRDKYMRTLNQLTFIVQPPA